MDGFQFFNQYTDSMIIFYNIRLNLKQNMITRAFSLLLLLSLAIQISESIQIPLRQGQFRCMLIYSMFQNETVKADINFPRLLNWQEGDKYYLTLRNTKTEHTENEYLSHGHFRRQITIYQRIIYEICFEFLSPRPVAQQIIVQYQADTHYMLDKAQVKLPENLLKQQHLVENYNNALSLNKMAEYLVEMQKQRAIKEEQQFLQTEGIESKIITISVIQILVILGVSAYQFCNLRKKIQGNYAENYI